VTAELATAPRRRARLRQWFEVVGSAGRVELQVGVQYRANIILWGGVRLLQAVISIAVWRAVARADGGSTGGFTPEEFAGYFLCVLLVLELTHTWVAVRLPREVRTGELSPRLLRPVHPLLDFFGRMGAYNLLLTLGLLPSITAIGLLFDADVAWTPGTILLSLVVVPCAAVTRFLVDSLVGVWAFWLTRVDAIRSLYTYGSLLLAGQFAPLELLPDPMQAIARALPFYWTLGFPVELLTGRLTSQEIVTGLAMLGGWSLVLLLVLRVAWSRGVRAYGAVGA